MNKVKLKCISFVYIFLLSFSVFSQSDIFQPKSSFGVDLQVPTKNRNPAFAKTMVGLLNGGVDYRYNVFKGITVGIGAKYSYFAIQTFAFNNAEIGGGYQIPGGYLRVGYERFTSDRVAINASVRGGYAAMVSMNDSCRVNNGGPFVETSFFVEPQIELLLLAERSSEHGFSAILGYSFYMHEFSKKELCMDEVPNLNAESYEGITRFLNIGFGYRYYLGRNK